ncbi:hypothetical protein ABZ814_22725 [Micromonospora musae]|uniref:hypothetical protein n=1 Tax=Micromonospora musae TaxID=1894970 RepID=UPI0033F2A5DA
MSPANLALAIEGARVTRRHKRNYEGHHRTRRNAAPNHLLSPAAYQLVTRTTEPVPAAGGDNTGLLRIRDIHPTGAFTTIPAVNNVNEGGEQ